MRLEEEMKEAFPPIEARDETGECDLLGKGKAKGPDRRWGPHGAPFSSTLGLQFHLNGLRRI